MRKYLLAVLAVVFVVAPAWAGIIEHEFTVQPELSHITYKEPGVMQEKGWFYGVAGSYTLKIPVSTDAKVAVGPELKLAKGSVDYEGSGSMSGIDDTLFEARLLGGVEFAVSKDMTLKSYTGFGYRSLVDDSEGMTTSTGAWGYERWIRYYYIPVGVSCSYDFMHDWKLKVYAEYDFLIKGKVTSYLGSVPGYEDIKNTQNAGYGMRAGIKVDRKFTGWSVSFGPYIKYWKVKDSEVTADSYGRHWIEPKNHSTEIGGALAINF